MSESPEHHFFEIPIYRVSERAYVLQFDRKLDLFRQESEAMYGRAYEDVFSIAQRQVLRDQLWSTFGGPWRYNQAVGWVRLYTLGAQVRGEYWMAAAERLTRRGRREFRYVGSAFTRNCTNRESGQEIRDAVWRELLSFQRECRGRSVVLDLDCFQHAMRFIDWRGLVGVGGDAGDSV